VKVLEEDRKNNSIEFLVEAPEDLYYLALIIERNDVVYGHTFRQIKIEREEGSERGERVKVYIGLRVEKKSYHKFSKTLRVTGRVIDAPESLHIKGSYHTISIGVGSKIKLIKNRPLTAFEREIIKRASENYKKLLLISVGEDEVAVGVFSPIGIKIEGILQFTPAKTSDDKSLEERLLPPLSKIFERLIKTYNPSNYEKIIIASPDHLRKIIEKILSKYRLKNIVFIKIYEGGEAGIHEIVKRSDLKYLFEKVRRDIEEENVEELLVRLSRGDRKIAVGLEEVSRAATWGAVKKLLIVDEVLFESESHSDTITLLDNVYKHSGKILLIPSDTETGKKLLALGGALAELYFNVNEK